MKMSDRVIIRFKCHKQKQSLMYKRRNLGIKSKVLTNLKFSGRLFVGESRFNINDNNSRVTRRYNFVNIILTEHGRYINILCN